MCPRMQLFLRARCFAPMAVTAPVRCSVIAVASMMASGIVKIPNDLYAGHAQRPYHAAQNIEVPLVRGFWYEVHARFDDGLPGTLRPQGLLNRCENLIVG